MTLPTCALGVVLVAGEATNSSATVVGNAAGSPLSAEEEGRPLLLTCKACGLNLGYLVTEPALLDPAVRGWLQRCSCGTGTAKGRFLKDGLWDSKVFALPTSAGS